MPYGSRICEIQLRCMARARIADGRLPVMFPPIICPRHGSDETCQLCGQNIDCYRVKYQLTDSRDGCELAFHLLCYNAWQLECWPA